jgi:hypothetical protein
MFVRPTIILLQLSDPLTLDTNLMNPQIPFFLHNIKVNKCKRIIAEGIWRIGNPVKQKVETN